ncbi:MAG: hypothetical protein QW469_00355 [Candidatus Aenigmatarchaeota archaeon]
MTQNNHYNLTDVLINDYKNRRTIGHYRVSDLWSMLNGYLPPEKFLSDDVKNIPEIIQMLLGETKHFFVEKYLTMLGYETEVKIEKIINDFVVVGRIDAYKDGTIFEIKTSNKLLDKAKKWHEFQLKVYLSLFEKNFGQVVQPVFNSKNFYLKVIGEVERDDNWFFNFVIPQLEEYHKKVVNFYKNV